LFQITLNEDGSYQGRGAPDTPRQNETFTGTWEIRGDKMVWRHDTVPHGPDINPILPWSKNRFKLVEENGNQTQFDLIERFKSDTCKPWSAFE
jgi:hypothetical protein